MYWPTDRMKISHLMDFAVSRKIHCQIVSAVIVSDISISPRLSSKDTNKLAHVKKFISSYIETPTTAMNKLMSLITFSPLRQP